MAIIILGKPHRSILVDQQWGVVLSPLLAGQSPTPYND
jgi:hypothetical protein